MPFLFSSDATTTSPISNKEAVHMNTTPSKRPDDNTEKRRAYKTQMFDYIQHLADGKSKAGSKEVSSRNRKEDRDRRARSRVVMQSSSKQGKGVYSWTRVQ